MNVPGKRNSRVGGHWTPTKHLRGVEQFQELPSSLGFIGCKPTIRVSHAQKLQRRQERWNQQQGCSAETLQGCLYWLFPVFLLSKLNLSFVCKVLSISNLIPTNTQTPGVRKPKKQNLLKINICHFLFLWKRDTIFFSGSPRWQHGTAAVMWRAARRRDRAPAAASGTSSPRLCSQPQSSHSPACWRGNLPVEREKKEAAWSFTGRYRKRLSALVLPCSSAYSTSDTQEDSQESLNKNHHLASVGWAWNVLVTLTSS